MCSCTQTPKSQIKTQEMTDSPPGWANASVVDLAIFLLCLSSTNATFKTDPTLYSEKTLVLTNLIYMYIYDICLIIVVLDNNTETL